MLIADESAAIPTIPKKTTPRIRPPGIPANAAGEAHENRAGTARARFDPDRKEDGEDDEADEDRDERVERGDDTGVGRQVPILTEVGGVGDHYAHPDREGEERLPGGGRQDLRPVRRDRPEVGREVVAVRRASRAVEREPVRGQPEKQHHDHGDHDLHAQLDARA